MKDQASSASASSSTGSISVDPQTARLLFDRAGKLLFYHSHNEHGLFSEFGIDFAEWTTGPDFMGLKFIPPGLHFFHYRFISKHGAHTDHHTFRQGFFFWITAHAQTLVFESNPAAEDLIPEPRLDPDHVSRLKHNIRDFDRHLGTYPLDSLACTRSWPNLTHLITRDLLNRILPPVTPGSHLHPLSATMDSTLSDTPHNSPDAPRARIRFTAFDLKRSWDPVAHGPHPPLVTQWSLDKSWLLHHTLDRAGGPAALLGEFQLAFVCLLVGHNYDGFEQWKRIMHLLCQAHQAVSDVPNVFVLALDVMGHQLAECPTDFFIDLLSSGNFVYHLLSQLMRTILAAHEPTHPLAKAMHHVADLCRARFGMELQAREPGHVPSALNDDDDGDDDQEDDEDRPVVVDLDQPWSL